MNNMKKEFFMLIVILVCVSCIVATGNLLGVRWPPKAADRVYSK
jgi:hypothetical protein